MKSLDTITETQEVCFYSTPEGAEWGECDAYGCAPCSIAIYGSFTFEWKA